MDNTSSPSSEYEKEIRALYRERNEKVFGKSATKAQAGRRWLDFLALLVLIAAVGVVSSIAVYNWLIPLSPPNSPERSVYTALAQPELADDFIKQLAGSSAVVFTARSVKAGTSLSEQSYLNHEALGQALVLSSDGWLVTTQSVVNKIKEDYVVMPVDGRVYPVEIVALDPVAPLVYLKIAARNLTATPFVLLKDLSVNEPVVVVSNDGQGVSRSWYLRYLSNLTARVPVTTRAELPVTSESLPDRFILDQALPASSKGAPVINLQGKVIGLVVDYDGQLRGVLPLINMTAVIDKLFSQKKAIRPSLGIAYVQSNWLVTNGPPALLGAILSSQARRGAVAAGSVAQQAGLKEGDKIIALDNERLGSLSLSLMLQSYRPEALIELTIDRAGQERKVSLTLGAIEGEFYDSTAVK